MWGAFVVRHGKSIDLGEFTTYEAACRAFIAYLDAHPPTDNVVTLRGANGN